MKRQIQFILLGICTAMVSLIGGGCASSATSKGMQSDSVAFQQQFPFTVRVQSWGGRETSPLGAPEISSDAFAQAVRDSIIESGLFRQIITNGSGDYLLEARILKVDKPMGGFDMTATMAVGWRLTHIASHKVIFVTKTTKSYTATVGDAIAGIKRVRLAEEGAARENIQEGLQLISQLKLQGNE